MSPLANLLCINLFPFFTLYLLHILSVLFAAFLVDGGLQ